MSNDALQKSLRELIDTYDVEQLHSELRRLASSEQDQNVLIIVSNSGTHPLPEEHLHGIVYFASEGSLDFSSGAAVKRQFEHILIKLSSIVKGKQWNKVYILPFGPWALTMLIKLLVFRITCSDIYDIIYLGNDKYAEIQIETRDLIVNL